MKDVTESSARAPVTNSVTAHRDVLRLTPTCLDIVNHLFGGTSPRAPQSTSAAPTTVACYVH
jgi:hypothetical protein